MNPPRAVGDLLFIIVLSFGFVLAVSWDVDAHRPLFSGDDAATPESAVQIEEPAVSYVVYLETTADDPYRWFVLNNEKPRSMPLQVGAPAKTPWESTDPVVTLFGPGLPERTESVPVAPSPGENLGSVMFTPGDHSESFYEPVTGTTSRILIDTEVTLPARGTYYGVVYDRRGQGGKFWLGIGKREDFGWGDVWRLPAWVRDVRHFHETRGWPRWMWGFTGIVLAIPIGIGWLRRRLG